MLRPILARIRSTLALIGVALLCVAGAEGQQIVINELRDIDFGRAAPTGGMLRADIRLCVAMDQRAQYQIQGWGEEYGGHFNLQSGPYRLPYQVWFTDRRRARGFRQIVPGQPVGGLRIRGNTNGLCRRANALLRVELPAVPLSSAPSGSYRSTLTLMVSPE